MNKILLGTTALIGASLLASSAMAAGPKVTVGGFLDFQAGFVDEDLDAGKSDYEFQNDTEIHFNVDGKSDSGLGYGAVVELEADVTADADGEGFNADRTYLYLEGGWGRTEMGSNYGPTKTMKVDASTFARATGGIDGDWNDFVTLPVAAIYTPDLLLDAGSGGALGATEDATKITYYTPRFSGFQLGASFIPDTGDVGQAPFSGNAGVGQAENVVSLGLNYAGNFNNVALELSATGEFGSAEVAGVEDLGGYALGASVSTAGFTFGGSWADYNESLMAAGTDAEFWTLGLAYVTGPFGASVSYMDSETGTTDFTNLVVGADYQLAPGMVPYVEVAFFDIDPAGTALDNSGSSVLVGTELTF